MASHNSKSSALSEPRYQPLTVAPGLLRRRQFYSKAFSFLCLGITLLGFLALLWIMVGIFRQGAQVLNWSFLSSFPSELFPEKAGIKSAIFGSLYVMAVTFSFAVPVGIGAAIFLQEYGGDNKFAHFVQVNIANLAGVPSIVYGMLGLAVFVRIFQFGPSILSGGLTLGLLVLPIVIIAAQEALRAVPNSLRHGSYALGATKWQTIRGQVLPVAMPGILTGIILAMSRAIGETAPLIVVGAATYIAFLPERLTDEFTVLPMQIFYWAGHSKEAFQILAAAAIIVLMTVLLTLNSVAIFLRNKYSSKM